MKDQISAEGYVSAKLSLRLASKRYLCLTSYWHGSDDCLRSIFCQTHIVSCKAHFDAHWLDAITTSARNCPSAAYLTRNVTAGEPTLNSAHVKSHDGVGLVRTSLFPISLDAPPNSSCHPFSQAVSIAPILAHWHLLPWPGRNGGAPPLDLTQIILTWLIAGW